MLFKHKCNLQTPANLVCSGIQLASTHHIQSGLSSCEWPEQSPYNSCVSFIHSSCPLEEVSLTSVILSSAIPKVPVTLALDNKLLIYFSCKIQGFPTPFFIPCLLKEGFLSWILSLHPSMKCGIYNQCQRKAFSSVSVGWKHKDIFCLTSMSHFLISFTAAHIQVGQRNHTM